MRKYLMLITVLMLLILSAAPAEGALGANIHASIDGVVKSVDSTIVISKN